MGLLTPCFVKFFSQSNTYGLAKKGSFTASTLDFIVYDASTSLAGLCKEQRVSSVVEFLVASLKSFCKCCYESQKTFLFFYCCLKLRRKRICKKVEYSQTLIASNSNLLCNSFCNIHNDLYDIRCRMC